MNNHSNLIAQILSAVSLGKYLSRNLFVMICGVITVFFCNVLLSTSYSPSPLFPFFLLSQCTFLNCSPSRFCFSPSCFSLSPFVLNSCLFHCSGDCHTTYLIANVPIGNFIPIFYNKRIKVFGLSKIIQKFSSIFLHTPFVFKKRVR